MHIQIQGAAEHNLKDVDATFGDGLTVVTGVSGSGKTSLVFDTLYHEARRRFLDIFAPGSNHLQMPPAAVRAITGLGPAIAVGQNLLNRNPNSTLATASGLHPFLRLLYANFGERPCARCGSLLAVLTEDEIVECVVALARSGAATVCAPLVHRAPGSHRTLLELLEAEFGAERLLVDGQPWSGTPLDAARPHTIEVELAHLAGEATAGEARAVVQTVAGLGAHAVTVRPAGQRPLVLARLPVCVECGAWFGDVKPLYFHTPCPHCAGAGCAACDRTGLHPLVAAVRWNGLRLTDLLACSVDEAGERFRRAERPATAARLFSEITRRLDALQSVGLGYIALNRSAPTLSRGEAQRVRLAVALSSRLEDMLHVLDEPTIGQHPADVGHLLKAFRRLAGPVIFVEHDRIAAAAADRALDIGPGAGIDGGRLIYAGTPAELWQADTPTGRFFSLRERVPLPATTRPAPDAFLTVRGASLRNLKDIDIALPLGRLTVISGVSGSGKSTFVEDVLVASLNEGRPVGCRALEGPPIKPVWVDQSPIGHNPRSNPATYTKLADIVRDHFAAQTGLSASHFSFNRPEGACPVCSGLGAVEVSMRYLPSTWITCAACNGQRFSDEVLAQPIVLGERRLSIADFYQLSIQEVLTLFQANMAALPAKNRQAAIRILRALCEVGLGYLSLGQPSPTLSGGEAQRVKLAKYLGSPDLDSHLLVLDEPSTGLHPQDLAGLLAVLIRLVDAGATVVVVEHNTDVIRAADWVVDLGPGAGPRGGQVLYAGPPAGLTGATGSLTARALVEEGNLRPRAASPGEANKATASISIRGARAHNLKDVDVDFPKGALTVVTGVSGSGKSSLVIDVLEAEARRRFLETLSLYERQSTREGPEAPVESVGGLGVSVSITPARALYNRRATVGSATEITHLLAGLFAMLGKRTCLECGAAMAMERGEAWRCPACGASAPLASSRHFASTTYAAACTRCHGVGSLQTPAPERLIVHPEKPLCGGAMYSPGFFPQGYLGKPYNGGYYLVRALAERYGFDPDKTPWNELPEAAQQTFLFGSDELLTVTYESRKGRRDVRQQPFPGFYGWIRDWDVGGTYTRTETCPACRGTRLRPEYLAVTLASHDIHQLSEMPLAGLLRALQSVDAAGYEGHPALGNLHTIQRRLRFLLQVGLGYLDLNRVTATLSAGEAQRIKLAGLLGSGLTSLTVLLDEPSRGMHPSEVEALLAALAALRDEGNTVIVVEHDPLFMAAADHLIEVGPGAGTAGGQIVAAGRPEQFAQSDTTTAQWLAGRRRMALPAARRSPCGWLTIRGARANNLRHVDVRVPLGALTGVCGVSGSGKSTLMLDTLGRALVPHKQTTSVAYEPLDPGEHDAIDGAPSRAILLDQSRKGIDSPMTYLGLAKPLLGLYAESEDAQALGLGEKALAEPCSVCRGRGSTQIDMGFLPDVHIPCDACHATGYRPEAWDVRLRGVALPECNELTVDELHELFGDVEPLGRVLKTVREVGLGYLVMRQPGYTLSSGEAQRLKIAGELCRKAAPETLYILDEPTVGQSLEDVRQLIGVLHRLVEDGHTVVVVEHHPHLLAACDWLIELGPGGGPEGGHIIAAGTPESLARGTTPSAPYVHAVLEGAR
jgi:excinuclease ABC subunit A